MLQVRELNQLSEERLCSLYTNKKKYMFSSFWCDLLWFGHIIFRNVCLLSNIIDLEGISLVVLKEPKIYLKNSTGTCPKIMNLLLKIIVSSYMLGLLCFFFTEQCVSSHP